jgi:predicted Zn-dependent protease
MQLSVSLTAIALAGGLAVAMAASAQDIPDVSDGVGIYAYAAKLDTAQEQARKPPGWRKYAEAAQALEAKDFAKAERLAQAVVDVAPRSVDARKLLGAAQIGGSDWRGAARTYAAVVRLAPGDAQGHGGLGIAFAMLNDPKAQGQLAWLTARQAKCAGQCPDAARLAAMTTRVQTALGAANVATK